MECKNVTLLMIFCDVTNIFGRDCWQLHGLLCIVVQKRMHPCIQLGMEVADCFQMLSDYVCMIVAIYQQFLF